MSQLIQMRQRIKTIETIKKITHAMQLIAMSSHTQLKNKQVALRLYQQEIKSLYGLIHSLYHQETVSTELMGVQSPIFILVGSQKGLCGNFNSALFGLCRSYIEQNLHNTFITVGKKAEEFLKYKMKIEPSISFDDFNSRNYIAISNTIMEYILHQQSNQVTIGSNKVKSFFTQLPTITQLLPFNGISYAQPAKSDYIIEQPADKLLNNIRLQYISSLLQGFLFESLFAEQAARFISMDASTRNANNLLETTKLQYNKLRQAKITKELIELSGGIL